MELVGCIDVPADGDLVQRHGFMCEGWVLATGDRVVEATIDGAVVGRTALDFARPDLAGRIDAGRRTASGFVMSCTPPEALRARTTAQLVVTVHDAEGAREVSRHWLRFSAIDYRESAHGDVLTDEYRFVLHRNDVYGSGPPSPVSDPRAVELLARLLRPGDRILDVGCGIGAYGHALTALGFDWTGVEVRADFVERMRAAGLQAGVFDGRHLPFDAASFDVVICIEVLEHVVDYAHFLAEIARVTRRIACFSVPNYEAVPVLGRSYAVPWHLLEADHKNFFTRGSLAATLRAAFAAADVIEYGPLAAFFTPDGAAVYNHLLGIGTTATTSRSAPA